MNTLHDGLFCLKKNRWQQIARLQGLQDLNITAIQGCSDGRVLVIHPRGIGEWYSGEHLFRHYTRRFGVAVDSTSGQLNCIAADPEGNVYVPYAHGLYVSVHMPVTMSSDRVSI